MKGRAVAAITGLGHSVIGRQWSGNARELAAAAVVAAVRDAGLQGRDIGGLLLARSPIQAPADLPLRLQVDLAFKDLSVLSAIDASGTSFLQAIHYAQMAVGQGQAEHIVCVFADTPLLPQVPGQKSFSRVMPLIGVDGWEAMVGLYGAPGAFALMAFRWMAQRSAGADDLGAYVRSVRLWASLNPLAMQKKLMTQEDYLASPLVVEPLRVADCAYPANGAIAVVVSGASAARGMTQAVFINALARFHGGRIEPGGDVPGGITGAAVVARAVYADAGVSARDMAMLQTYDAFSFLGLMALEDYGFCARGEAGAFVQAQQIAPGGSLPMNTGGGLLAGFYLQGATPVHEAVVQLRGAAGERQVARRGPTLVGGIGGRYEHHAAMILSLEEQL